MPPTPRRNNSCSKPLARSSATASSAPWWYATELQAVQKIAEQQSQDLKRFESTLCSLQRRMTETTHSLAQRMEALEKAPTKGKGTHDTVNKPARGCHNDTRTNHLDAWVASIADLETRFELFSSDAAEQMATCASALAELQEQTRDGPSGVTERFAGHLLRMEKLIENWEELQTAPDPSGSADPLQETIRNLLPAEHINNTKMRTGCESHSKQEQASQVAQREANGRHRLRSPRSGQESRLTPPTVLEPRRSGSADPLQETIRNLLPAEHLNNTKMRTGCESHSMQEQASQVAQREANGRHRLHSPRSGQESRLTPPTVLEPRSAPVTPRSMLQPPTKVPPALRCPGVARGRSSQKHETQTFPKKRTASVTSQRAI